jgi:hypothetical protein
MRGVTRPRTRKVFRWRRLGGSRRNASTSAFLIPAPQSHKSRKIVTRAILDFIPLRDKACCGRRVLRNKKCASPVVLHVRRVTTGAPSWRRFVYIGFHRPGNFRFWSGKVSVSRAR